MEQKKKLVIKILTKLLPYWDLAAGFLVLVKEAPDDIFIETLLSLIKKQIATIKDKHKKQTILSEIDKIKKIKSYEEQMNKQDKEEAERMLDFLVNEKV